MKEQTNNFLTITKQEYIKEGTKLNILEPSEIIVKEKTNEYIILKSSLGITEVRENNTISLLNSKNEIIIKKGETKKLTLPITDYSLVVTIRY